MSVYIIVKLLCLLIKNYVFYCVRHVADVFRRAEWSLSKLNHWQIDIFTHYHIIFMANFIISLRKTLIHGGGYSNDPDDRGGETYKGVSRHAHKNWKGWDIIQKYKSKPGFPKNLNADIELQKEIEHLYRVNYWNPINGSGIMTQSIADSIFDFAVNAGVKTSIRLVQSVIGTEMDGIVGSKTLVKLNSTEPKHFHAAFTVKKIAYYTAIIKKRPANKKFLYGWITRVLTFSL